MEGPLFGTFQWAAQIPGIKRQHKVVTQLLLVLS